MCLIFIIIHSTHDIKQEDEVGSHFLWPHPHGISSPSLLLRLYFNLASDETFLLLRSRQDSRSYTSIDRVSSNQTYFKISVILLPESWLKLAQLAVASRTENTAARYRYAAWRSRWLRLADLRVQVHH